MSQTSEHTAEITWQRDGAVFTDQRYPRRHVWRFDGGAEVPGSSSPHSVRVPFSDPSAVDPEEAFVASIASCHMLWFLSIAAQRGFVVERYRDAAVGLMGPDADGRVAVTEVTLRPETAFAGECRPTGDELHAMHHAAHEACFIANSVKTAIRCEPRLVD